MHHYTYRIINKTNQKEYIGVRTSNIKPKDDLGHLYFSSSTDLLFIADQKNHPENYSYQVMSIHPSRISAISEEISLHLFFDVARSPNFYNKANQTSSGFDTTGLRWKVADTRRYKKPKSKTHREKIRISNLNKQISPITRNKISETLTGITLTDRYGPITSYVMRNTMNKSKLGIKRPEHSANVSGSKNGRAKIIDLFDVEGNFIFRANGNLKELCLSIGIPPHQVAKSYRKNTKIFTSMAPNTLARLSNNGLDRFCSWFAKEVVDG